MKTGSPRRQSAVESTAKALAAAAGFELMGDGLDRAVESALRIALAGGAVFPEGDHPLAIFRATLSGSICDIETDARGRGGLLQRFLREGPYEQPGPIPRELRSKRLTAAETAKAATFIYSFMVNSFKGR